MYSNKQIFHFENTLFGSGNAEDVERIISKGDGITKKVLNKALLDASDNNDGTCSRIGIIQESPTRKIFHDFNTCTLRSCIKPRTTLPKFRTQKNQRSLRDFSNDATYLHNLQFLLNFHLP